MTHPARLLVDLAGSSSTHALEHLVDEVLYRYPAVSPHAALAALDRAGKRAGGPALRLALAPWQDGPRPESPPEMALFRRLSETVGPPERQYEVTDPETGRLLGRVDLAYPDRKVAIEYDGRRFHNPRTAEHDDQRKDEIQGAGWTVESTGLMS